MVGFVVVGKNARINMQKIVLHSGKRISRLTLFTSISFPRVHRRFFSFFFFSFARRCAINLRVIFRESWTENATIRGVNRLFCIDCQDLIFVDEISLSLVNDDSCVLVAIQFYIDQRVKF